VRARARRVFFRVLLFEYHVCNFMRHISVDIVRSCDLLLTEVLPVAFALLCWCCWDNMGLAVAHASQSRYFYRVLLPTGVHAQTVVSTFYRYTRV
jgi:hypothetical protein